MDDAIALLAKNHWFHVFSEGKVNQSDTLLPFRWGIARLILESPVPPLVIAFYHSGLEKVMPESRRVRIPTVGVTWTCRFGSPIDSAEWITASKNMHTLEQKRIYITQKVFEQVDALRCESAALSQKPDTN
jgi:monolysocardiolipin acyltransferase